MPPKWASTSWPSQDPYLAQKTVRRLTLVLEKSKASPLPQMLRGCASLECTKSGQLSFQHSGNLKPFEHHGRSGGMQL